MTPRIGRSRGECFDRLVPRNLRTRRALRLNDLYRRFECLPLRQTVWNAGNSRPPAPQDSRFL